MASPGHARRLVDETSLSRSVLDFGSVRGNPTTVRRFSFVSLSPREERSKRENCSREMKVCIIDDNFL